MTIPFITKLRKRSESEKERFAIGVALGVTVVIGAIWVASLPARFSKSFEEAQRNNEGKQSPTREIVDTAKSDWAALFEGFTRGATDTNAVSEERENPFEDLAPESDPDNGENPFTFTIMDPHSGTGSEAVISQKSTATQETSTNGGGKEEFQAPPREFVPMNPGDASGDKTTESAPSPSTGREIRIATSTESDNQ